MNTAAKAPGSEASSYRLIGLPESGYTVKVRSALRYKDIDFEWLDRFRHSRLYRKHAKVQLIPLMLLPDGSSMQDSTPILEHLEAHHSAPSLHPSEPDVRFLSELLEEYGDEWGNKLMFHYRWGYPADQERRGKSLASGLIDGSGLGWLKPLLLPLATRFLIRRMVPRMAFAGANENNAPLLIESFSQLVEMLNSHLSERLYLFGGRPAFGDFGLWGQLYQAWLDPTCESILKERGPHVVQWIRRMEAPSAEGKFESLGSLEPTLKPVFEHEVGPRFLAWSDANARAWESGQSQTEVQLGGRRYYQNTFKYPAHTLEVLRGKYRRASDSGTLRDFLNETGCLAYLQADE